MLNRLKNLFSTTSRGPIHYEQNQHGIQAKQISSAALRVIQELQKEGWQAYLVGGGVRDILLGDAPKDFDVATDATPETVQKIFHRARIIGRRFKIVHVRIGREIIEVTTFRGAHEKKSKHSQQNNRGMLLRDNVYGDLESDALRRDFTVNALYYDPSTEQIIDYTDAIEDLRAKRLRIIGAPNDRYKEDPVRMLRAVRFSCKLGFTLDEASEAPIFGHANYLADIPPARRFEEVLKLFLSGYANEIFKQLHHYKLLEHLFYGASLYAMDENSPYCTLLEAATTNTDKRLAENKRVTPAFIFAAFLWPALQAEVIKLREAHRGSRQELQNLATQNIVFAQQQKTAIPKRFQIPMREIWMLQARLEKRDARNVYSLLENPRFRAAYDFLLLREQAKETNAGLGDWWTEFQHASDTRKSEMLAAVKEKPRRRRTRRKNKPANTNEPR